MKGLKIASSCNTTRRKFVIYNFLVANNSFSFNAKRMGNHIFSFWITIINCVFNDRLGKNGNKCDEQLSEQLNIT